MSSANSVPIYFGGASWPQCKSTVFADPTEYLSDLPPTITTFSVMEIMAPPSVVVKALGRAIILDPEAQSIVLVHSPAHRAKTVCFPLWLATIWSSLEKIRGAKILWRTALDPVYETLEKQSTSDAAAGRIKAALAALEKLPWDGDVKNFRAGGSEDQMLELLTLELGLSDGSTSCIETTFFAQKLSQAYSDPDSYRTARGFRWLRRLGGSFATKNRSHLGSIANKNEDHWFTLTIDCEKEALGYGDGFRGTPSAGLRKALDWWIFEHLGVVFKSYRIRAASSRTSTWHIGSIGIKMFLRIFERHERKAGGSESEARDCELTFEHSLQPDKKSGVPDDRQDDRENDKTDDSEYSPPGSEYSGREDDSDHAHLSQDELPNVLLTRTDITAAGQWTVSMKQGESRFHREFDDKTEAKVAD
ncbi:hypothetical protein C8J57DRAFT_1527817 [Mycena rebaudengoi]|nr:hypothetical protein C8J57DRAFT_1527817 [Mycena rebaudengoi]